MARKIKKNDVVKVISGACRGQEGSILSMCMKTHRVFVSGVNVRSRHVKPSPKHPEGGIVPKECPIHISNVALKDPDSDGVTRVGFRFQEDGVKVRYAKKSGAIIGKV